MTTYIQKTLLRTCDDNMSFLMDEQKVTPSMLRQKMNRIIDWYKIQPHLPNPFNEKGFLRHLAIVKYDEEKVKSKIETLLTSRTMMPEIFSDRDPLSPRISKALKSLDLVTMPTLTEKNYRITVVKPNINNHETYDLELAGLCFCMVADVRLNLDTVSGDIFVYDVSNLSFSQITQMHLPTVKKLMFILQSCYGSSIKGIHIINAPQVAEFLINIIKAALKSKVASRLKVYSTKEEFEKSFPMKYLPKDMGGGEPLTLQEISKQWGDSMKSPEMRQFFLDLESMKSDESKRLGKRDFLIDDMLGMRGTFRKLDLD